LRGILAGANVVMPNLSPVSVRDNYTLYDHKANTGLEAAEGLSALSRELATIGCQISVERGDAPR
jgi:biotin synthase